MAGKILGLGAAGLLQMVVWLISARVLLIVAEVSLPLPDDLTIDPVMLGLAVLFFILAYLFFGTLVAGVSAMASSPQEGTQVASFVIMFGFMPPALLVPVITNDPNGTLARVFTFIPVTSPMTVMLRLAASTTLWLDIVAAALLLALATLGALFLASRVFRASLLLQGTRPRFGEIWRALRTG
jgi:ABC-2 type transport system permease protein